MRVEEKEVDGQELHRAEQKDSLLDREDKELQQGLANERLVDKSSDELLLATMQQIIEKKPVHVRSLGLPPREAKALEQLQQAVTGRDVNMNTFVFADDRRTMLEQALAVLQPNMSASHSSIVGGLRWEMSHLVSEIHELRLDLRELEDAQEDGIVERQRNHVKAETPAAGDTEDKPVSDPDAPKPKSSLSDGPAVVDDKKPTSIWEDEHPDVVPAQKLRRIDLEAGESPESLNPSNKAWWRKPRE